MSTTQMPYCKYVTAPMLNGNEPAGRYLEWFLPFGREILRVMTDQVIWMDLFYDAQPTLVSSRTGSAQEPLPGIPPLQSFVGFRVHQPCPTPKWNVEFSAQMVAGQHLVDDLAQSTYRSTGDRPLASWLD